MAWVIFWTTTPGLILVCINRVQGDLFKSEIPKVMGFGL